MSNTHFSAKVLRTLSAAFVLAGIVTTLSSTAQIVTASLIGPGSTVLRQGAPAEEVMLREPVAEVPLADLQTESADLRLVVAMLLVLAGFGFHALGVVRAERAAQLGPARRKRPAMERLPRAINPTLRKRAA